MRRGLIILAIVAIALFISGCCSGCGNIFIPDPDTQRVLFADDYDYTGNNTTIIGGWSSVGSNVSIVDPGIAYYSWYGTAPDGEWYIFKDQGYYKYVKMSTENGARGGVYRSGKYSVDGNSLRSYDVYENYYPGPNSRLSAYENKAVADERLMFELRDNNTLSIDGGMENSTYYRILTG